MDHAWARSWTSTILVGPFQLEIFYNKKVFHKNLETEFLYLTVTFYFWCRTPVVFTEPGKTQKTHRGDHSSLVWQLVLNVKLPAEQFPLFADSVAAFPSQHWQQLLGISVKWPRAVGKTGIPQEYGKRRPPGERSFRFGANVLTYWRKKDWWSSTNSCRAQPSWIYNHSVLILHFFTSWHFKPLLLFLAA